MGRKSDLISTAPIALLDSGAGGIGVLQEVKKLLPLEQLLYFGDAKNAPYGEKSPETVREIVLFHAERLLRECKALVLACNTATAVAVSELRRRYPQTPIIGMEPALAPALSVCQTPKILVLATDATLKQEKFAALRTKCEAHATILSLAAPGIVRLVEAGLCDAPEMDAYLRGLLAPYQTAPPDAIVLGCTHFPFAKNAIRRAMGRDIPLFDGAVGTARQLARTLSERRLLAPEETRGGVTLTASKPEALALYCKLLSI